MARKIFRYAFPIICVVIVFVAFYMINDIKNKVDDSLYNTTDIDNEFVEDEILNETEEIENEVNEITNEVENATKNEVTNTTNTIVPEEDIEEGSTSKKQEAIALVKKEWGEDSSVTYRCESVNAEGKYIVAVIMKSSGTVKAYFKVDLESKSVIIDY